MGLERRLCRRPKKLVAACHMSVLAGVEGGVSREYSILISIVGLCKQNNTNAV